MNDSINFRNPLKLLVVYRFIKSYIEKHTDSPSHEDLIEAGLAASQSVVSYYYQVMVRLKMIKVTPNRGRSVHPLPIDQVHWFIKYLSEYDWVQMTAHEFQNNHFDKTALIGQHEWECMGYRGPKILFARVVDVGKGRLRQINNYVKPDRLVYWRRNKKFD